jgi:hypothetical protein
VVWFLDAANAARRRGDCLQSIAHCDRVLALDHGNAAALCIKADCLEALRRYEDAYLILKSMHDRGPSEQTAQRTMEALKLAGRELVARNEWARAVGLLQDGTDAFPDDRALADALAAAQHAQRRAEHQQSELKAMELESTRSTVAGAAQGASLGMAGGVAVGVGTFVGGAVVLALGMVVALLGLASIPCCIGLVILPAGLWVMCLGLGMMLGGPVMVGGGTLVGALAGAVTGLAAAWRRGGVSRTALIIVGVLALLIVIPIIWVSVVSGRDATR